MSCPGYNDGQVWLLAQNTCAPTQYSVDGIPLTTNIVDDLAPGNYVFTIVDALGRTDTLSLSLEAPVPMSASAQILDASAYNASDGQILIDSIAGGASPYTLLWSNGAISDTVINLLPGIYALTITDSLDCPAVFEWEVGFANSTEEVHTSSLLHFWPNPAENTLWVQFQLDRSGPVNLQLSDYSGKIVWEREESCPPGAHTWKVPLDNLPPGIFFANLGQEVFRFVKK